jgi:putative ABC transport system permease protein
VTVLAELSLAARTLRRAPGSAAIAVFALGLGIGLSALIFSIVEAVPIRGLPFDDAHELVRIERTHPERGSRLTPTIHDYQAWRESQQSFDVVGAYFTGTVNLRCRAASSRHCSA